jgi:hypothetical protein
MDGKICISSIKKRFSTKKPIQIFLLNEMKKPVLLIALLLQFILGFGQTPGLILKPAVAPGKSVLDPDGDGYVSMKTNGVQLGFTIPPNNDITQSEIPYVPIVRPDPLGDLLSGPTGGFGDIVGTDAAGNNAVMTYFDGTNLLVRFRIGDYSANSKDYSLLIDTDQKFGFTGTNADPNAVAGNPGFEIEIACMTNFSVAVYNINGTINRTLSASYSYETNCQKSKAISNASGNPDYFYDFYVPFSALTSLGITTSTPLRFVAVTTNNPDPATGNNNVSDVGGVTTGTNLDMIYSSLVEAITPTSTTNLNTAGMLERSACPVINSVAVANTTITGTSTEVSGTTITVYVYQSNGTTLIGSGITTTSGTTWSINVSALSPTVTLAGGQIVKATATAPGKGVSYDNCSMQTVTNCSGTTGTNVTITMISGGKGYTITNTFGSGTIFTWYNADFTLAQYPIKSGSTTMITNPVTSTAASQTVSFVTSTGQTFPNGIYYFTFQEPGKCVSQYLSDCQYGITGTSGTPTFTTTTITPATTTVSGTCTSTPSPGAVIYLYVDGVYRTSTTVINGTTWTISGLNFTNDLCKVVTIKEADGGKCPTAATTSITISRTAVTPTINTTGCYLTPPSTISGYSTEIGATVTLYRTAPTAGTLGTATVQSNGTWSVSGLTLSNGNVLVATVTSGSCLLPSNNSSPITITTQTNVSNYTIGFTTPIIQNSLSVSGTVYGGSYPVTLKLYSDQVYIGSTTISSAGSWTVSGLNSFDLAIGSTVQVTLTGTGCESSYSSTVAIVQCSGPTDKTFSAASSAYCYNSYGTIIVQNSELNILYTPMASDGTTTFGYSALGTGSNINLTTYQLTNNPTVIKVKASKLPAGTCDILLSGSVTLTVNPLPAAPTATSPQTFCATGTTTLADLAVTVPTGCSKRWYSVSSGGIELASTTTIVSGTTYYVESYNTTTGCVSSSRTAVLVQTGSPAAPTASSSQTFCSGSTVSNLVATLSGPGTISWYSTSSGGTALTGSTLLIENNTYYAETVQNTCKSSSRTAVTVHLNPITGGSIADNQTVFTGGDPAPFTQTLASTGGGTLSYQWQSSTASSSTGFSDISGANQSTYDPPSGLMVTTWYKRITFSTLNSVVCSAESNVLTVTASACTNPSITVQPTNPAPVCENNGTATISVTATGTNVTYQWYVDGTTALTNNASYSGVTTNTLTISNPAITLNGKQYTVKLNGSCGSEVTSNTATLTVNANPTITVQPSNPSSVCENNGTATISVTAYGAGLLYQWYVDGTTVLTNTAPYSGVTTETLTITNPAKALNGKQYKVQISGSCGSPILSNAATLSVDTNPVINTMTATTCSNSSFSITPVTGTNGVVPTGTTYSWSAPIVTGGMTGGSSGSGLTSINGLLTNPTSTNQTATYAVTPVNGSCTGTPFTLTLTVIPKPAITTITTEVCSGSTFTVTPIDGTNGIVPTGTTYSWSSPAVTEGITGGASGSGSNTISGLLVNPTNISQTATFTVTPTNGSCGGATFAVTVTVNPKPSITDLSISTCTGNTFTLLPVNGADGIIPVGTTYSWTSPIVTGGLTGGTSSGWTGSISGSLINPTSSPQTATYTITPKAGNCTGSTFTATVNINPLPTITVTPDTTICAGSSVVLNAGGGVSYSWTPSAGLSATTGNSVTATPAATTTYAVTGTNSNGCSNTAAVIVTLGDLVNPTITCKSNLTRNVEAGMCYATILSSDLAPSSYTDNCSINESNLSWTMTGATNNSGSGLVPTANFGLGVTSITYTITDSGGNQSSCIFTVTVTDTISPTINCRSNLSRNTDFGHCYASILASDLDPLAYSDNCSVTSANLTYAITGATTGSGAGLLPLTTFNKGVSTVTYTITDNGGNSTNCSFTVTVIDNIDPTISCVNNITRNIDAGQNYSTIQTADLSPVSYSDNCVVSADNLIWTMTGATVSTGIGVIPTTLFNSGTTTVAYTVTDGAGRSSNCAFTVTVIDNVAPVITCPSDITVNANINCTYSGSIGTASATDNVDATVSITNNAPLLLPLGNTIVTWSATDHSGNNSTCTQTVTVINSIPIAADDLYSVIQNTTSQPSSVNGNVLFNDTDPEDQYITATSWTTPSSGSVATNSNGTFVYTPATGFTGSVTFDYVVSDVCGQTDTGTVTIEVESCITTPSIPGPIKVIK